MKKILLVCLLALLALPSGAAGKPKTKVSPYPDAYLDTVNVTKKLLLNDYSMFGFEYGISRNSQMFTPRFPSEPVYFPEYFGVTFTRYGKLIGSPVVGFQIGAFYGHEGYQFQVKEEEGRIKYQAVLNATRVEMSYAEVPFMAVGHYDMPNLKLQLCIGPYAGYRLSIHRSTSELLGLQIDPDLVDHFADFEKRFDYGLHGGVGFGLIFDPFEFQVNLRVRYSWSSLWEPSYNSEYYYRYAYPLDFMLTGGIHFHFTRRYGKTRAMLRLEARERVFNPQPIDNESNPGTNRP
ncbi:MAG: PorT family protein [Bacteroidales bacterium]|nr:PorT family protein [Bacteroidales bacterium]